MRALAIVLLLSTTAVADNVAFHKVKQNDSLALIASEFYGDRGKSAFIMAENKMLHPRPLRPGERLRIPVPREIATSPGDSFQSLGESLLGDPRRGAFLADANNMTADSNLAAGVTLVVPFTVTHVADGHEPIKEIATTYYGDPKFADVLRKYNSLDPKAVALEKGETIVVPSYNLRVHPTKLLPLDTDAKQRRDDRKRFTAAAATAIPAARHAWRVGDYAAVRAALDKIDTAYVDLDEAIEINILLGCALVAFNKDDEALAAFKRAYDRKPNHVLRKVDYSPKVLAVWKKVDGQIE